MSFSHPHYLWLMLLAVPLVAIAVWSIRRSARLARFLAAPRLAGQLLPANVSRQRAWKYGFFSLALVFGVAALAGPRWGVEEVAETQFGRDVVLVLDVSRSMLAVDVPPTRLARAKIFSEELFNTLRGDRIGLVAFAGRAFLQAPLTTDTNALSRTLTDLDPEVIPVGGSNLADGLRVAREAFGEELNNADRAVVLVSDGEELRADARREAAALTELGIKIFSVGVGTPEGSTIPIPDEFGRPGSQYVRDPQGGIVTAQLDEVLLREVAELSGGAYTNLNLATETMQTLLLAGLRDMEAVEGEELVQFLPIERYQWFLLVTLLLSIIAWAIPEGSVKKSSVKTGADATGMKIAALLLVTAQLNMQLVLAEATSAPTPSAGDQALLEQNALDAYEAGEYEKALEIFETLGAKESADPSTLFNAGAAAYKNNEWDDALEFFGKSLRHSERSKQAPSHYNLGNTLFRKGEFSERNEDKIASWRSSLQHYDSALQIDPDDEETRINREIVAERLRQLEEAMAQAQQRTGQGQGQGTGMPTEGEEGQGEGSFPDEIPEMEREQPEEGEIEADQGSGEEEQQPQTGEGGRMSPEEAQRLFESLESEEDRVWLHERVPIEGVYKDW
ncbi:MAG: VWA domain-containing protein [Verrucomicrobiales bacterium]